MPLSRTTATVLVLSSAVLLGGCSGSNSESGSGSGAPTPTPVATAAAEGAVTWADGVCSASTQLQQSVRDLGGALQTDPSGSATSLDQARAEVRARVTAVQQSAESLKSALAAVPAGADPKLAAAQQQLQTASQRAQSAVDELSAAAGQVVDAQTAREVAAGLATLKTALTGTADDLTTYFESLRSTVTSREQALRSSFGAAPACQDATAPATVST